MIVGGSKCVFVGDDCGRCEGGGNYSELAPCTTAGPDCACNGPRVLIDPCPDCGGTGVAHGPCEGRLEWHHAIKQQRLKREFKYGAYHDGRQWQPLDRSGWHPASTPTMELDDILGDTRNRIWLCSHHHELVTNGRLKVDPPESVWEFAREFGLEAQLENDIARAA